MQTSLIFSTPQCLCAPIKRLLHEATEIFENMRIALINTKEREKELEGSKKEGKGLQQSVLNSLFSITNFMP
jgi:hypothetical protein